MALKLKVSSCVTNNCSQLTITDVTGLYNATLNLYGWNQPDDVDTRDATSAATISLTIGGTTLDYDVVTQLVTVPTTQEDTELVTIDIADFGLTSIPDGLYTITYNVTVGGEEYTITKTGLSTCAAQCCIDNRFKQFPDKLAACCNQCEEAEFIKETYIGQALIDGLHYAYLCGNLSVINKNLTRIQRICGNIDCGCN
tara:strand:- start:149 stop:742 length:594 start_codon:yes stop_codon:yes gene_type:complete